MLGLSTGTAFASSGPPGGAPLAAGVPATEPASATAAPTARIGSGCLPRRGYCVVLSRQETAAVASGNYTAAIATLAAACGLVPPPGNILCAAGGAIYGPGLNAQAKNALAFGQCLGLTDLSGSSLPVPVPAIC